MSDVIAAVKVNDELIVYIDYDKPVWQNAGNAKLASTPSLDHFLVDGILGSCSLELLSTLGVKRHFSMEHFLKNGPDVEAARKSVYSANNLKLECFYYDHQDPLIDGDSMNFSSVMTVTKLNEDAFYTFVKPVDI
ncbi:MAG: hypothetical protein QNK54_03650 [Candidatus Planktophila sp.]